MKKNSLEKCVFSIFSKIFHLFLAVAMGMGQIFENCGHFCEIHFKIVLTIYKTYMLNAITTLPLPLQIEVSDVDFMQMSQILTIGWQWSH